jgi:hypothetical protein
MKKKISTKGHAIVNGFIVSCLHPDLQPPYHLEYTFWFWGNLFTPYHVLTPYIISKLKNSIKLL